MRLYLNKKRLLWRMFQCRTVRCACIFVLAQWSTSSLQRLTCTGWYDLGALLLFDLDVHDLDAACGLLQPLAVAWRRCAAFGTLTVLATAISSWLRRHTDAAAAAAELAYTYYTGSNTMLWSGTCGSNVQRVRQEVPRKLVWYTVLGQSRILQSADVNCHVCATGSCDECARKLGLETYTRLTTYWRIDLWLLETK